MERLTILPSMYTSILERPIQQFGTAHGPKDQQSYPNGAKHCKELVCDGENREIALPTRLGESTKKYFTHQGSLPKQNEDLKSPCIWHGLSTKRTEVQQAPHDSICSCSFNQSLPQRGDIVENDYEFCEIKESCSCDLNASILHVSPSHSLGNCLNRIPKTKSYDLCYMSFACFRCFLSYLCHFLLLCTHVRTTYQFMIHLFWSIWTWFAISKNSSNSLGWRPLFFLKTLLLLSLLASSRGQLISHQEKQLDHSHPSVQRTLLDSKQSYRIPLRTADITTESYNDSLFTTKRQNQHIGAAGSTGYDVTLNNEDATNLSIFDSPKSIELNGTRQNLKELPQLKPFDLSLTFGLRDFSMPQNSEHVNSMKGAEARPRRYTKHRPDPLLHLTSFTNVTDLQFAASRSKRSSSKRSSILNRHRYGDRFYKSLRYDNRTSGAVYHNTSTTSTGTEQEALTEGGYLLNKPIVYIAGLFPWSGDIPAGAVGRGVLPAVQLALEHVNNDTRVDRKYILEMAYNDTRCDMAVATRAFFDMMAESQTTTAMLFGDACYNVTGPMVQIAHQWDMFQLSYGDTNPMLSDRDEYPNFYRTVPSDSDFNPARLALLRAFNWSTVGTLFQDAKLGEGRHGYAHNRFDSLMTKQKINVSMVQSFSDDPKAAVGQLKEHDIRIIVGNFDQDMARRVFCGAYHEEMYGAKYQWIILGTYDPDWWLEPDPSIDCTVAQLNITLQGYLATDVLTLSTNEEITEWGKTPSEYLELYNAARGVEFSKYHGYAYDGVWVIAKALDRLLGDVRVSPDDFRGPLVGKVLNETAFLGVTGRVQFLNGDRVGSTTILQMQYGSMMKVGEYHALTDTLDLSIGEPIVWIDGHQPADRSIKLEELRRVSFPVYVGFVVMAALGITMAVFFLAVNIRFRHHRYIKMSSPNMNNLIIVGSILCYLSVILLGAEPGANNKRLFSYWCTARSWTLALGFTLAFGAMFGKTWRVHAIFTNIKLNKKVIKDYKLMLIVLVLVLADASILITWQVVDPFDLAVKKMSPEVSADLEIIPKINYCSSRYMELWLGVLYISKGLLLVFGCFLAWETRHVSIPALNDSQYIGMSVYNVVIMCVSGAAVSFIIKDRPTQSFVIIGLFIVFCTTITLCLVFLPKIIQLKRNPKGDESRVRATLRQSAKKTTKFEFAAQREKMKATYDENRTLRASLEQKAVELDHLMEQLGDDVTGKDLRLRSSLMHRKILALRTSGDSPGKLSVRSYNQSEMECMSMYSEASAVTATLLISEDWSPRPSLFKTRDKGTRAGSESIELSGVRFLNRKQSVTIPPAAEEELSQDDPFGGVYLGPPDSPVKPAQELLGKRDSMNGESSGERLPLVANSVTFGMTSCKAGNNASLDGSVDIGAQGPSARRGPPRSLRLRRHSSPVAPIWTIAESCLEEDNGGGSQKIPRPSNISETSVTESGMNNCVDRSCLVTETEYGPDSMEDDTFRKPSGGFDNAWREGIFPPDFRIKRVLEKFPEEASEEEQPLMQPFSSPDRSRGELCMTPPENQALMITPQTPLVPNDVCRPTMSAYGLRKMCDGAFNSENEFWKNAKDITFPEPTVSKGLCWDFGVPDESGKGNEKNSFSPLVSVQRFNNDVFPAALNQLHSPVFPEKITTATSADELLDVEADYWPSLFPGQPIDNFSGNVCNHLQPSWHEELNQRPATPQPLPSRSDLLPSFPCKSPTPKNKICSHQNAGRKRKLRRSVSDPAWSHSLSASLTTSSFNQALTFERDSISPPLLTPSVPATTNGPIVKFNSTKTIRLDCDLSENTEEL